MHGVFAFSFGGHGSGRHLADGSLIIRGGLYAGNEVSCNRGEFRVDVRHSELRLPRLRRKHGLCRPSVQVPRQVSAGLARNLGASPVRWFRQTIDKGDQSELISEERIHIKQTLPLVLVISASVLLAQDNNAPKGPSQNNTKPATEQTVVTLCQQAQRRFRSRGAGPSDDLRTSLDGENKGGPLPRTTSRSGRETIAFADHKL